jgi:Protein of unknown function (DUF3300)
MNILGDSTAHTGLQVGRKFLGILLSLAIVYATLPRSLSAYEPQEAPAQTQAPAPGTPAPAYAQQTPEQLQQLVAPIALYPDSLVAQILAASTFPEQVVEADRFLQSNPNLKGKDLAKAVDQQPWDPSVKALTAFPSVLGNMDKNLSWTSSLGDAYYNQQGDVMDAIQVMRQKAEQAGNLKTTPQQKVVNEGPNIVIDPVDPDLVYVPAYDPWVVYGYPILPWPGWYEYPGIWFGGPYLSFGVGFGIGFFAGFGWGWPYWGFDWYHHYPIFNHARYFSRSTVFFNRNNFYRGGGVRGGVVGRGGIAGRGVYNRPGGVTRPFGGDTRAARGYAEPHGQTGVHSGAFSGFGRGGQARSFSSRGSSSFGGFHGGAVGHGGGRH